jgi:hypothetical protein
MVSDEIASGLDPSASNYIVSSSYAEGNLVRVGGPDNAGTTAGTTTESTVASTTSTNSSFAGATSTTSGGGSSTPSGGGSGY